MSTSKMTMSRRFLALLLCAVIVLGMIPAGGVVAVEALYGDIDAYTEGVVTGNGTNDAKLMVSNVTLTWVAADASIGRVQDGWWIGINVIAPEGANLDEAAYQRRTGADSWSEAISFRANADTENSIQLWGLITEDYLKQFAAQGKNLNYVYRFDWNADGEFSQTVSMTVDPNTVILLKDGQQVHPLEGIGFGQAATITPGAAVTGTEADVKLQYADLTLDWVAANPEIGRNDDGWWVGMNITAPEGVDPEKATFQNKTGANTWGEPQTFASKADTPTTMEVWGRINESFLSSFAEQGRMMNYVWRFDWNGDGQYEQAIAMAIDPTKVTLLKDGEQVYPEVQIGLAQVESITPGATKTGTDADVKLQFSEVTLDWEAANPEIGRNEGGWRVGMNIIAPEGVDPEKATFQAKIGADSWGEAQTFASKADTPTTMGLWGKVNESYLASFAEQGRMMNYIWRFDWDGDGEYEQVATMAIDPTKVILMKDGQQVYPVRPVELTVKINGNGKLLWGETAYANGAAIVVPVNEEVVLIPEPGDADTTVASIKVNGNVVETLPTQFTENATVEVDFVTKYNLKAEANMPEGVEIALNNQVFVAGDMAEIQLQANEGYQIRSITVNDVLQKIDDKTNMTLRFPVKQHTVVKVNMVRIYTVSITTNENGKVTVNQNGTSYTGGEVIVAEDDGEIKVTATPDENYLVEEIIVNDDSYLHQPTKESYGFILNPDRDYTINISFAKAFYNVITASTPEDGGQILAPATVNYGEMMTASIVPETGYEISAIKVNGVAYEVNNPAGCTVTIEDVKQDQKIEVAYKLKVYDLIIDQSCYEKARVNVFDASGLIENKVTHGREIIISIVPKGFDLCVKSITINGEVFTAFDATEFGYEITFSVTGEVRISDIVLEDAKKTDKAVLDILYAESDVALQYGNVYIMKPGAALSAAIKNPESDAEGQFLRLEKLSDEPWNQHVAGALLDKMWYFTKFVYYFEATNSVDLKAAMQNENTDILVVDYDDQYIFRVGTPGKIQWQEYSMFIDEIDPLVFVYDNKEPTIEWTTPDADCNGFYTKPTEIQVIVNDPGVMDPYDTSANPTEYSSGIAQQMYIIGTANSKEEWEAKVNNDTTLVWNVLPESGKIPVSAVDEGNKNVYVTVKVVDRADHDAMDTLALLFDQKAPTGKVTCNEDAWDQILSVLTFGIYGKENVDVVLEAADNATNVKVEYYVSNAELSLAQDGSVTELENLYSEGKFQLLNVGRDGKYTVTVSQQDRHCVYFRITDEAGNNIYLNSDGIIVDRMEPEVFFKADQQTAFNKDTQNPIVVTVSFNDRKNETDISSGIQTVQYKIFKDSVLTKEDTVAFRSKDIPYDGRTFKGTLDIEVDTVENNSSNVVVWVQVKDNAGNEKTVEKTFDIDITAPEIDVYYESEKAPRNDRYFSCQRTATITITERSNHFDENDLVLNPEGFADGASGFVITAVDAAGNAVEAPFSVSDWKHVVNEGNPDLDTHSITITYDADANYTFDIQYTDKAGNKNEGVTYRSNQNDTAWNAFTVDKNQPTGSLTAHSHDENGWEKTWDEPLAGDLIFGYWAATKISVTGTRNDDTSPIESVEYYVSDETALLSNEELAAQAWRPFTQVEILPNRQCVVYVKITDMAGNVTYLRTEGLIVDNEAPREETIAPQITVTPPQPVNDIYNTDVNVDVKVVDPSMGNTFAGLKHVWYEIKCDGKVTQSEDLYTFKVENPSDKDLQQAMTAVVTVDSDLNNSNDVVIIIYAEDNAGNTSSSQVAVKIDKTMPTIHVSYDNNVADSEIYYNADRTATIVITERNFNPADVNIAITSTNRTLPAIPTVITDWTKVEGKLENGDDTTYIAKIRYAVDADYTFSIDYADMAGNPCSGVVYAAGTTNPEKFTLDKTAPVIRVSYDNNDAQNDKYFNALRTATVIIEEHNFSDARVLFTLEASRGGVVPTVQWAHNGDTHVATIRYTADGDYTFDVTMKDLAGNSNGPVQYGGSVAAKDFVIDTTFEDMLSISGVENETAYGYSDTVIPSIKINDINLDVYSVSLVGTQKGNTIDLTEQVKALLNAGTQTVTGIFDIFNLEQGLDGIYTLTLEAADKAGNQQSQQVVFTVNRFGSVYVYNDYLMDLIKDGGAFCQSVDGDLVITEYNADKLVAGSLKIEVTCDGKPLDNVVYSVTPKMDDSVQIGESGWYQYEYTISENNFDADGVYKISVSSEDATGNTPENNNYEDMGILFRVDSSKADLTSVVGLENSIINAESVTVKYTVFDSIGLKSVKIFIDDQLIDEVTDFGVDMNNYEGSFVINESDHAQKVRICVEDMSGNITDTDAEGFTCAYEFNDVVTVSTNFFVRWYANPWLFWGSIIGIIALVSSIFFFIIAKRKKKEEEPAK